MTGSTNGNMVEQGHEITYVSQDESKVMEAADTFDPDPTTRRMSRRDHLQSLIATHKTMMKYSAMKLDLIEQEVDVASSLKTDDSAIKEMETNHDDTTKRKADQRLKFITQKVAKTRYRYPLEVRMKGLTYQAEVDPNSQKIQTVYNSSIVYKCGRFCKKLRYGEQGPKKETKVILDDIHLVLQPGKFFMLVLSLLVRSLGFPLC